jgi:hypothetical protein
MSTIDEKKNKSNNGSKLPIVDFFRSLFGQLFILGIIILVGSLILFNCKVAQTNLLPTCLTLFPYTDVVPPINPVSVDINIVKTSNADFSTKLSFSPEENMKSMNAGILGSLKNMVDGPNSSVYKLYIATTLQELIATNFTIINSFYNLLNSYLSETFIIFVAPVFSWLLYLFILVLNNFYMWFLWFKNISLLFSEKTGTSEKTTWKAGNMWTISNILMAILTIYILVILFFILGIWLIIPLTVGFISIFCLFYPLGFSAKNTTTGKPYGVMSTIVNILKYKLSIIMIIISLFVILNSSSLFGGYTAFVAVIACLLLYFFSDMYTSYIPKAVDHATSGLGDFLQATKTCISPAVANEPQHLSLFGKLRRVIFGA